MQIVVEWGELVLALSCFMLAHVVPVRPAIRSRIVDRIGRGPYILAYSILSLALLAWVARAAGRAPYVELWPYDEALATAPVLAMPVACLLLVFGLSSPNNLSLGWSGGYDPTSPGIAAVVRHPVLWAALIWATAHLAANGDLAHALLFGSFAVLAVAGMMALDRRKQGRLGIAEWQDLARRTSNVPFLGLARGARPRVSMWTIVRLAGAVVLYWVLVASHELLAVVPVSA
jgi:uncharacterized membrane protein